ncbi:peptide ABC transporter substrate-binding protein [Herpetosiphon llansteffanensis]|uniref:peptide ABC transporter substrate-binding protein n=1 Tax=Herpetosiphon llansteffanensis TaxID=2094568 RepID=UPI0013DFC612|nr:peptide ABC transporter substrate-binding protein [Herpetosiphon llansteffanensis]
MKRLLTLGLLAVLLTACSLGSTPAPTSEPTTPPIQIPQGGTLTIRTAQDISALHPWKPTTHVEAQMLGLLYRGLTKLDQDLAPQPDVASSWQSDSIGQTLTMTLRSDIRWHDDTPLTAADAAWTISAMQSISPTTPLLADIQGLVSNVTAPDATTLVLSLREPYAPLLSALSMPILPKHLFGQLSPVELDQLNLLTQPVGSGPFIFEERTAGSAISLIRNNQAVDGVPYLDRVAFVVAPDAQVAREAVRDGDLLAAELPWEQSQGLGSAVNAGHYAENGFYYLAFNMREGRIFNDMRVRQALALSLDLNTIVETAGPAAQGILSDHLPGTWVAPTGELPSRNLDKARELLDQAGWVLPEGATIRASNGITLSMTLYVRGDDQRRIEVAERIAAAASPIGFNLVVTPADFESVIRSKLVTPFDFDLALMSWGNSRVGGAPSYTAYDPDNFSLFHSSQIYQGVADGRPGLRNYGGFRNANFDNLSTAARAIYDTERRRELYQQTNAIIQSEYPYVFLWADRMPVALAKNVRSTQGEIRLNTANWLYNVQHWYLEQ